MDKTVSDETPKSDPSEATPGAYDWFVLGLLLLCHTLAFMDAKLPQILIESMKADLGLSDTDIGLITGPAFSLTYAAAVVPIARLSDRSSRKYMIAGSVVVWSALTAAAGLAQSFAMLLLTRMGVAIGEAGLTPAAHSTISDRFPARQRATAIAIYSCGIPLGIALSMILGGLINDLYGWRPAMFLVGGGGFFLSLLILSALREPLRKSAAAGKKDEQAPAGQRETLRSLFSDPVIRYTIIGGTLVGVANGSTTWLAPYAIRTFGVTASQVGASFGPILGIVSLLGTLLGGVFTAWLSLKDPRRGFWFMSAAFVLAAGLNVIALTRDTYLGFLIVMCFSGFILTLYLGPTFAAIQSRARPASRSFASGVTLFCLHGFGISVGAFLTGWMSDNIFQGDSDDRLRWALGAALLASALGGISYFLASRHARTPRAGM